MVPTSPSTVPSKCSPTCYPLHRRRYRRSVAQLYRQSWAHFTVDATSKCSPTLPSKVLTPLLSASSGNPTLARCTVTIPRYVYGRSKMEDRQDMQGLTSADRNSKATLPLTVPRPIRVVCRRSSPRNCPVGLAATTRRNSSFRRADRRFGTRGAGTPTRLLACNSGG